ncbi:MAG: tetratricopeptide repeat protein [Bacteroidota bacterium]
MSLTNKAKSYIRKHHKKKSASSIADHLNVSESDVQAFIDEISTPLSTRKKVLFYAITVSIPIVFFVTLELILRGVNYMGETRLFVNPDISSDEYLIPNYNFASKYFFYTRTTPSPSTDAFLMKKPENGYRVFVMGGSSAAGYPYGFNGTFSRVVNDILTDALPDKKVEVINVGISAINSYTLYDQVDEIISQSPDAILVYAGHNEFYGALGVGSNENLGAFPGFVRLYLKLQRFKTFLFLRSVIVDSGKWIAGVFSGETPDESGTLMERIVDSRSIELDSPKHDLAMLQFESNMTAILETFQQQDIPVFFGSVASNLKDHPPFVTVEDGEQPPAGGIYQQANEAYIKGDFETAKSLYVQAKDLDGLKFRAPSDINTTIKTLSDTYEDVTYVPVEERLSKQSPNQIIGFNYMLEHLHPNQDGYFQIGRFYSEAVMEYLKNRGSSLSPTRPAYTFKPDMYLSDFDSLVAWHRVETLKQGFPFVQGKNPKPYQDGYFPTSFEDSLAFLTVHDGLRWDKAKVTIAKYHESQNRYDAAVQEYRGLIRNQPWNDSPYVFAARLLLDQNRYGEAEPLLRKAYELYPQEAFTTKMLGAIELNAGNSDEAIRLLEESRAIKPNDLQTLYNLSGAYGVKKEFNKALEIVNLVLQQNPNFPGALEWKQRLLTYIN